MRATLKKLDALAYRVEKYLAAILFLVMSGIMFAYVAHRVFSREESRVAAGLMKLAGTVGISASEAAVNGPISSALNLLITFIVAYAALRTMVRERPLGTGAALGGAAVLTGVLAVSIKLALVALPNGIVWASKVALSCMIWVGFLGASMATYERRHLALEMSEKIWPARLMPYVRGASLLSATALCAVLLAMSILSIQDHYQSWMVNPHVGVLESTSIPRWAIFLVFPYAFTVMGLRFLAQAIKGEPPPDPALMLPSVPTVDAHGDSVGGAR